MSTNSDKYTLQPISHTHIYTSTLKRCSEGVFDSLVQDSVVFLALSVYVIFSSHIFQVLLASEASFNPVGKKKYYPHFPMLFAVYLQCLKDTIAKYDTYTLQPIIYVYVVKEEVPGKFLLACGRPAAAVAVSEKQVSAV